MTPLMQCGHRANAKSGDKPVCASCVGLDKRAELIDENPPELKGRMAFCTYCGRREPSSTELPFFSYNKNSDKDSYYDGCRGWG